MKRKENISPLSKKGFLTLICAMALLVPIFQSTLPSVQAIQSQQITLDQNWGYYDSTLHIHGSNFSPNSNIVITWSTLTYWSLLTKSDASGTFDLFFNVPAGVITGSYIISASDKLSNSASTFFTLRSVYATGGDTGSFGIRTPTQLVQWNYANNGFYLDVWQFYNTAYGGWYSLLNHNYGTYITRFNYNGVTYVFDLAGGKFNSYPSSLYERVLGFSLVDVNHILGIIKVYDPTGVTLLFAVNMDIYTPPTAENYYLVTFTITAATSLSNFEFYAEQNLDVWTSTPNWASYNNQSDVIYQYYGPDQSNLQIPQQYSAYAGFGSTLLASSHHDAAMDYTDVQNVATNLIAYNFTYRDRNQANGESYGNPGLGLQWKVGTLNAYSPITIGLSYAESDDSFNQFNAYIAEGKMLAYQLQSKIPFFTLTSNQAPGSAIIQISGQNFMPNDQIKLKFAGISVGNFLTDGTGNFQGSFIVPTSVTGNYNITATDQYGLNALAPFTVIELTLNWLLTSLNQFSATITSIVTDPNGQLYTLINTNDGNILAKLSDVKASLTQLVTTSNGQVMAQIDTAVGSITTSLTQINANIVGIIRDTNNNLNAKIDTAVGTITTKLDQINANIVGIVVDTNNNLYAKIDTAVGTITTKLDQINATIVGIVRDTNNNLNAKIDTAVGTITTKLDQINASITSLVTNINGTLTNINGTLTNINGTLCALINTSIGSVLASLSDVNASLTQLVTTSNGQVMAQIDTAVGNITANLDQINANIVGIIRDTNNNLNAKIDTDLGITLARLDAINATLIAVNGSVATIKTTVGTIATNLTSINAKITISNGNLATIQTDLGMIKGTVTSMENGTIAIETKMGIIKTTTKMNNMNVSPQMLISVEIAAIAACILTIFMLRKGLPNPLSNLKHDAKVILQRISLSKKPQR